MAFLMEIDPHVFWHLGRAGGFVAFGLLLVSLVLGIAVSSRIFDGLLGRAWFFELHKFVSLLVVPLVLFHALVMLPDPYAGFSIADLLVLFHSPFMRYELAIGILTLYALALLALSFYATKWIGQKTWRSLHYLSFVTYAGAAVHGVLAGTDSDLVVARIAYLAMGAGLGFFVFYRILASRSQKPAPKKQAVAAPRGGALTPEPVRAN
jgi:predicted ferric reductase